MPQNQGDGSTRCFVIAECVLPLMRYPSVPRCREVRQSYSTVDDASRGDGLDGQLKFRMLHCKRRSFLPARPGKYLHNPVIGLAADGLMQT